MQPQEKASALVLFDIDGTLLRRAGPHHRQVLEESVLHFTGRPASTAGIPVQGMLDGDILRQMLTAAEAAEHLEAIMRRAQWLYARRCPDLRAKVTPHTPATLQGLRRLGAVLGLVTGNLSKIGWKKMQQAGLKGHFRFGAFAEMGRTRAELAGIAVETARSAGWIDPNTPISLVGDHPNDVLAAKANRLRSVAVGTGVVPLEELANYEPDLLLPDFGSLNLEQLLWR